MAGPKRFDLRSAAPGGGQCGLRDIGRVPMTGRAVARIAAAERLATLHALKQLRGSLPTAPARALKVGSRGSRLARAQVDELAAYIEALLEGQELRAVCMPTPGDRDQETPLPDVRDDDFFTRDLDESLLRGELDLAVHSAKDLPTRLRAGIRVAAVTPTLAPWECLVSRDGAALDALPAGARVGTSSERRRRRLLELRPDLRAVAIRGNVPDRLAQLERGDYDALLLAAVGLARLGLADRIAEVFPPDRFSWTPGQGSLAVTIREDDRDLAERLAPLDLGERRGMPWA